MVIAILIFEGRKLVFAQPDLNNLITGWSLVNGILSLPYNLL